MDFLVFIYCYFACTAFLVFVLLFGQSPALAGTPVRWLHWLITSAWLEALESVIYKLCGTWGKQRLDDVADCCCDRPNPCLQITYLSIFGVGYYLYWEHLFRVLPNTYAAEWHIFTGTAAVCLCLTLFVITSLSDPGHITAANAGVYAKLYPCDDAIFPPKQCSSCGFDRPARSKHCNVCGRCIARFDHHCGWVNNCIGLYNMRTFLAFLAANCGLCVYGAVLCALVLAGHMERAGLFEIVLYNARTKERMPLYKHPQRVIEWLVVHYPIPVALLMFLVITALLTAAFVTYQCWLIAQGRTTYETFKWQQLQHQLQQAARLESQAVVDQQAPTTQGDGQHVSSCRQLAKPLQTRLTSLWHRATVPPVVMSKNIYNRGVYQNFMEVLFPERFLSNQQQLHQQHLLRPRGQKGKRKGS